jgi:hypothetical protein
VYLDQYWSSGTWHVVFLGPCPEFSSVEYDNTFIEVDHGKFSDVCHAKLSDAHGRALTLPPTLTYIDRGVEKEMTTHCAEHFPGHAMGNYSWYVDYGGNKTSERIDDYTVWKDYICFHEMFGFTRPKGFQTSKVNFKFYIYHASKYDARYYYNYVVRVEKDPDYQNFGGQLPDMYDSVWARVYSVLYEQPDYKGTTSNGWINLIWDKIDIACSDASRNLYLWYSAGLKEGRSMYAWDWSYNTKFYPTISNPRFNFSKYPFLFDEDRRIYRQVSNLPHRSYESSIDSITTIDEREAALEQWLMNAYLDAINNVPRLSDNSISNVLEIYEFIRDLVVERKITIPKSLSDVWLAYRYQYQTTKLDIEEAISFVHRYKDLNGLTKWFKSYGEARKTIEGTDVIVRCSFSIRPKDLSTFADAWRHLYTYGLTPSFYTVWDMIPFSFIADWVAPIGDIAKGLDQSLMYNDTNYDIRNIIYSVEYVRACDDVHYHCYTRWVGDSPSETNGMYWVDTDRSTSQRVIGYRILDVASLILGGK